MGGTLRINGSLLLVIAVISEGTNQLSVQTMHFAVKTCPERGDRKMRGAPTGQVGSIIS